MIGQTVSHYRILQKLGEGGMGVVYKAIDTKLDRPVALKFLPPELTRDPDAKRRFVHEAKAASALQHHNICTIHEIDETDDGRMFICMDCYEGETVKQRVADRPLPVDEAIDTAIQAAEGLAKAHEAGMVHRDIKSANLIVTTDGVVKIVDFGLAKLTGQTKMTKTGTTVGTVAYMSPEQARGEGIDHRTDIWSLGVLAYEMLTGQLPFKGDHEHAVTYQITQEDPEPITALRTGIPMELERIVNKCLEKKSSDRYQHIDELIVDLRKAKRAPEPRPGTSLVKYAAVAATVVILAAIGWKLLWKDTAVSPTEDIAVAVVDFRDLGTPDDVTRAAGVTSLVQVGLVESSPCRVVSPQYLYDLRRRLFGAGRGPIQEDQALEVARESGAAMLLSGQMVTLGTSPYITWQLVDTRSGKSLGARRVGGDHLTTMADQIIAGVLPLLARECGVEEPTLPSPVAALTSASPEAYEYYMAGVLAQEKLDQEGAVREFEQAVKLDSTFALAYYELSNIYYYMLGGTPEHRPTYDNAEKAWKYRANMSIKDRLRLEALRERINGRIQDAIAIYREMFTRWPDDKELLCQLSGALSYHWHFDEGASVAREGLSLYPDEPVLVVWYANSLGFLGRPGEALEVWRTYAEQHPRESNAWGGVAWWFLAIGLPDSAETACQRALEIEPEMLSAQRYLTYCDYYRGNLQRAIENQERLLRRSDLLPGQRVSLLIAGWIHPTLTFLYAERGQFKKALELFEEAKQFVSDSESEITIELRRNRLLLRLGRAEDVLRWARDVPGRAESSQNMINAAFQRVRALAALDSLETARAALLTVRELTLGGSRGNLFIERKVRAEIELAERNSRAALTSLHEMKQIAVLGTAGWWEIEWREALALTHWMAGRLDEAAKVHEEMLGVFRGHSLSHYDLGLIYEEMGRTADAMQQYAAFLNAWVEADEGLPQVEDAKKRLAVLNAGS